MKITYAAMMMYAAENGRYLPTVYSGLDEETWREDWKAGGKEILVGDHGREADLEFADHSPFTCNTSALWLLVRDGTANASNLVCPETRHEPYKPTDDVEKWWSFKALNNCSYSYQNTLKRPIRDGGTPREMIVLADVNPLRADVVHLTKAAKRPVGVHDFQMNSPNHGFKGQNVLDMSGAVEWIDKPIGSKGNNIWVKSTWENKELLAEDDSSYSDKRAKIDSKDDEWLVP